jgi:hypothetical protein
MTHHTSYLAGLGFAVTLSCALARADTLPLAISITDLTEGAPTVLINGNPPVGNTCALRDEHAQCSFQLPSGSLGGNANDQVRQLIAVLKEPGSTEVSDEVRLSLIWGTPQDTLVVGFQSDAPGFAFEEDLGNFAVTELAGGNGLTGNFVSTIALNTPTGNLKRGDPVALPAGLTVRVQSDPDPIPEPPSLLLALSGIAVTVIARIQRRFGL